MFKNKTKCAVDIKGKNKICSKPDNITMLKNYLHTTGLTCKCLDSLSEEDVIKILKKKFNLTHEYEIYKEADIKRVLGNKTKDILNVLFVNKGPSDSTALLSNFDIDNLCKKWMNNSEQFNKKYYHIQFQMIDFLDYPNKLRDLNIPNLIKNKYDCFSCVLNTDISSGRGKHWFCIYGDMTNIDKNGEKKIVIEHFNSSGMPIRLPVLKWLENTVTTLKKHTDRPIEIRYKPRANGTSGPSVAKIPFEEQAKDTYCVVTSISLCAVEAQLLGIPTICHTDSFAKDISSINIEEIENPKRVDTMQWFYNLAYSQFTQ